MSRLVPMLIDVQVITRNDPSIARVPRIYAAAKATERRKTRTLNLHIIRSEVNGGRWLELAD
jgi:hypothetical protein